jgi:hypothetical protein
MILTRNVARTSADEHWEVKRREDEIHKKHHTEEQ